jgi:hypothetical protein
LLEPAIELIDGRKLVEPAFVDLLKQNDGSGDLRGCEAGAVARCKVVAVGWADDSLTRSREIGRGNASDGRTKALGVGNDLVAGARCRGHADRVRHDRHETFALLAVETVARGGDDRDVHRIELVDQRRDLLPDATVIREPVLRIVIAVGERDIDGRDIISACVINHPLKRRGDLVVPPLAVIVKHPKRREIGTWRDPRMICVGRRDDSRDRGSVFRRGRSHRVRRVISEVISRDDLVARSDSTAQGLVVVIDAGVDDGDGHAGSVDTVLGLDLRCTVERRWVGASRSTYRRIGRLGTGDMRNEVMMDRGRENVMAGRK